MTAARVLAATRRERADRTPIWFMRQAGRSLPEYRALRQRLSLMEMVHRPELCAQVTCMPVDLLGVDAAVLFADIMLPLEGMGIPFAIREGVGPVVGDPIRSPAQVRRIRVLAAEEATPYLFSAIRLARAQLGERAALIGFAASPFTLACYLVEGSGSRDYPHVRALMHDQPALWHQLMTTLTEILARYLLAQAGAGVQLVQVFDSWVGVLDAVSFQHQVAPHLTRLFAALAPTVPALYFSTGSAHLLRGIAGTGAPGVSVDWRLPLDRAWHQLGRDRFIQGNLDPALVLCSWDVLKPAAEAVMKEAGGRPGHIFNLGHGVLPDSDPDQLRRLVELVHSYDPGTGGDAGEREGG
ncbi:MAG: uroporphyrinogen decarboxylase [Candidatus Dormibacteria bacterium]